MNKFRKPHGNPFNRERDDRRPGFVARPPQDFGRRDRGDKKELFDAVCAHCGKACQVPFRPNGQKPVYCKECFNSDRGSAPQTDFKQKNAAPAFQHPPHDQRIDDLKRQVDALHAKVDRILEVIAAPTKETAPVKAAPKKKVAAAKKAKKK
jgi:CxxC-x17-CxxC domain-containing protein